MGKREVKIEENENLECFHMKDWGWNVLRISKDLIENVHEHWVFIHVKLLFYTVRHATTMCRLI